MKRCATSQKKNIDNIDIRHVHASASKKNDSTAPADACTCCSPQGSCLVTAAKPNAEDCLRLKLAELATTRPARVPHTWTRVGQGGRGSERAAVETQHSSDGGDGGDGGGAGGAGGDGGDGGGEGGASSLAVRQRTGAPTHHNVKRTTTPL